MTNSIISLCYVNNVRDKTVFLNRVADFHDDHFEVYNSEISSGNGNDRGFIVGFTNRITADLGSFGVYEWYAYEDGDKWKTDVRPSMMPWTKVIVSNYSSPKEIISAIKQGWRTAAFEQCNLIICCKQITNVLTGIFLPVGSLDYDGNTYTFSEEIFQVEIGIVYREDLLSYRSQDILLDDNNWHRTEYGAVRSSDEILDSVLSNLIGKIDKDALSRKERQAARTALAKLSADSIEKALAERMGCSEEEAHKQVSEYLRTRQLKLSDDQIASFISILIDSDAQAVLKLRQQVENDWQQENADKMAEARQDITAAKEVLQSILHEQEAAESELKEIRQKKDDVEKQIEDIRHLQKEVEAEIEKRLSAIRTNKVESIVNEAFLSAAIARQTASLQPVTIATGPASHQGYSIRYSVIDRVVEEDTIEGNYNVAVDSIKNYCVSESEANELILYLFAVYVCRQHLVMTGETAESLAIFYSSSITGIPCPVVTLEEKVNLESLSQELKEMPNSVVAIREANAACYESLRELMRKMPDTQFIRLLNHEESLLLEPNSFYTTFLPIPTDMFCQSTTLSIPDGFSCITGLTEESLMSITSKELKAEKNKWHKWLSKAVHAPLLERRCAEIQIIMQRLAKNTGCPAKAADAASITYLYAPLMKFLRNTDSLEERLTLDNTVSASSKEMIKSYCGIEDESL